MTDLPPFDLQRLGWEDEELGSIDLPKAPLRIARSFGSGLATRPGDPPGQVWATGDRGPNLKIETLVERYGAAHLAGLADKAGAKVMPRLDVGPRMARLQVDDTQVRLIESMPVRDAAGRDVSGLPMADSEHARSEPAFDLDGAALAPDPSGLDPEGIVALAGGGFLLSEEFGPSLVRLDDAGRVLGRYLPEGCRTDGAAYPVHAVLPAIAARRQLNRGFEAVAASLDGQSVFVAFQSPLAHPDVATHRGAAHVRLWQLDVATLTPVAQYLYALDPPESFGRDMAEGAIDRSDLKISELVCLADGSLLVLERASQTTKIYCVRLGAALPPQDWDMATRPSVEERSAAGEALPCVEKTLLFTSDAAPELSADLEGMAVLSPRALLLVNDNDFGVEGGRTAFWRLSFQDDLF